MKIPDWNKRPKGCRKTVSGMHIPRERMMPGYSLEDYCSACGLIDDTGEFREWMCPNAKNNKVDDLVVTPTLLKGEVEP